MKFAEIVIAHKAAAYAAYRGSAGAPNISKGMLDALAKAWSALTAKARDGLRAPFVAYDPATWFEHDLMPSNWDTVESALADFNQTVIQASFESLGSELVKSPDKVWHSVAWLARVLDAAQASPPALVDARQVVKETLTDWGDGIAAIGSDVFDTAVNTLKYGFLVVVGGIVLFFALKG